MPTDPSALCLHVVGELPEKGTFHVYDEVGRVEGGGDAAVVDALMLMEFKKEFGHKSTVLAWNGKTIRGAAVGTGTADPVSLARARARLSFLLVQYVHHLSFFLSLSLFHSRSLCISGPDIAMVRVGVAGSSLEPITLNITHLTTIDVKERFALTIPKSASLGTLKVPCPSLCASYTLWSSGARPRHCRVCLFARVL